MERIDVHLYVYFVPSDNGTVTLTQIMQEIIGLRKEIRIMEFTVDNVLDDVTQENTQIDAMMVLLEKTAAGIKAAGTDKAKLAQIHDFLTKKTDAIKAAILANTPEAAGVPSVSSISPTSGPGPITINGSGFGATQGRSTVTFGGSDAGQAGSWSDTSIVVALPAGLTAGPQAVVVTTAAGPSVEPITYTAG